MDRKVKRVVVWGMYVDVVRKKMEKSVTLHNLSVKNA
jgi:hypothetical protein